MFLVLVITCAWLYGVCNITLPAILASHMVLQQQTEIKLWGWCEPTEEVKIRVSWDTATYAAKGNNRGEWIIQIKSPVAGGPYQISFSGWNNKVILDDVLIGEVWLCGGQSNMNYSAANGIKQAIEESPHATNPSIRFFFVDKIASDEIQNDCKGRWVVCTPETMLQFSAVGYFFGKELNQKLNQPIGLINASWGGTSAEVWAPASVVENDPLLKESKTKLWKSDEWWPNKPGVCYNGMIYPITNFTLAGTIWYQGESNSDAAFAYRKMFTSLIASWRAAWKNDFPFYYVQIAPSTHYAEPNAGALLREAQTQCQDIPNTGMVVIHDLVDNIKENHHQNKRDVGLRLANYALAETYHQSGVVYKSPMYQSMNIDKSKITLTFSNAENGLVTRNGSPTGFFIAGENREFLPATVVKIRDNTVIISNDKIAHPVAVRFGFSNTAMPNLYNKDGLPVNTFRTDNWDN